MEKKPLNHFLPGTPILSFGTAGCNLACNFCQNHDVSKSREMDRMSALAQPQSIAQAAAKLGCSAIAFTYNDPIIFHEYASDIAEACHDKGLKAVAVTAGYISDAARPPDVPLHFSAFHPDYRMKEHPRTPTATLARARQIALKNGVRHCYTGNVHDLGRQSSYCHGCGERVIGRDWYQLSDWQLDAHSRCLHCGTALPGVFDGPPGTWGRKRLAVDISAFG
jgi:pyruvate-formate lyase-activating enzyme